MSKRNKKYGDYHRAENRANSVISGVNKILSFLSLCGDVSNDDVAVQTALSKIYPVASK